GTPSPSVSPHHCSRAQSRPACVVARHSVVLRLLGIPLLPVGHGVLFAAEQARSQVSRPPPFGAQFQQGETPRRVSPGAETKLAQGRTALSQSQRIAAAVGSTSRRTDHFLCLPRQPATGCGGLARP